MGRGVDDSHAMVVSVRFGLEGTPGDQETLVSPRLHRDGVGTGIDDRDFQGSATAELGVGKCGIRGWGRCAKTHPCLHSRWPGQALDDRECCVTGRGFAVDQLYRFRIMTWLPIIVDELLSITIRPPFHAEILARQSDDILLSRLQNRCQLTIHIDMTLIYRESISPVLRPVDRGWQGKALCLVRGDFAQSAKIYFNPLLSVFGIFGILLV